MANTAIEGTGGLGHIVAVTTITTAATKILDARMGPPYRQGGYIQNLGATDVYIGFDNAVTATGAGQGFLLKGSGTPPNVLPLDGINGAVWAIIAASTYSSYVIVEIY